MRRQNRVLLTIAAVIGAAFMFACNDGQIDEANKLITASNKKVEEAKALLDKTTKDSDALLAADIEDLAEFKAKNEAKAKEIMANYDKCADIFKAAAKDFEDAGKLKLNDKLKAYVDMKAKQLAKTSELVAAQKGGIQALISGADEEALTKAVADVKSKTESLQKESDELNEKVKKFEAENKDVIK